VSRACKAPHTKEGCGVFGQLANTLDNDYEEEEQDSRPEPLFPLHNISSSKFHDETSAVEEGFPKDYSEIVENKEVDEVSDAIGNILPKFTPRLMRRKRIMKKPMNRIIFMMMYPDVNPIYGIDLEDYYKEEQSLESNLLSLLSGYSKSEHEDENSTMKEASLMYEADIAFLNMQIHQSSEIIHDKSQQVI
jgi:hypothetical protein